MKINYKFDYPPVTSKALARKRAVAARDKAMVILRKAGIAKPAATHKDIY